MEDDDKKKNTINTNDQPDLIEDLFNHITAENIKKSLKDSNIEILKEFYDNPNIINNKTKLLSFVKEITFQLKIGNYILIPFFDILPTLITSYIENELNEEENSQCISLLNSLKANTFISKEVLCPIYDYFSDLFFYMYQIKENDDRLKKFSKIIELWKVFYDFYPEKPTKNSHSAFFFINGGLKVGSSKELPFYHCSLFIIIHLCDNFFDFLNDELVILSIENQKNNFTLKFNDVKELFNRNDKINSVILFIMNKEIKITVENEGNDNATKKFDVHIESIDNCYILKHFYGQIKRINVIFKTINDKDPVDTIFEPYLINDEGYLHNDLNLNLNKDDKNDFCIIQSNYDSNQNLFLIATNKKRVRANFINYLDNNFNKFEYFGGFPPFLPFIQLINGLYTNENIKTISGINKKEYLNKFFMDIFLNL